MENVREKMNGKFGNFVVEKKIESKNTLAIAKTFVGVVWISRISMLTHGLRESDRDGRSKLFNRQEILVVVVSFS